VAFELNGIASNVFHHSTSKPVKKPTGKAPLDERRYVPLSSVQSLYDCRVEVIITHTLSTLGACETCKILE
jgi:hypothetical protein